jgi:hypothetical protein
VADILLKTQEFVKLCIFEKPEYRIDNTNDWFHFDISTASLEHIGGHTIGNSCRFWYDQTVPGQLLGKHLMILFDFTKAGYFPFMLGLLEERYSYSIELYSDRMCWNDYVYFPFIYLQISEFDTMSTIEVASSPGFHPISCFSWGYGANYATYVNIEPQVPRKLSFENPKTVTTLTVAFWASCGGDLILLPTNGLPWMLDLQIETRITQMEQLTGPKIFY